MNGNEMAAKAYNQAEAARRLCSEAAAIETEMMK